MQSHSKNNHAANSVLGNRKVEAAARKALEDTFSALIAKHAMPVFLQSRTGHRVMDLMRSMILMGHARKTITNTIVARGEDQQDWTSHYRAFNASKWDPVALFCGVVRAAIPLLPAEGPIVLAIDDTALPKSGKTSNEFTRWVHNPLCPKWQHPALQWGTPMFHATLLIPTRQVHRPTAITVAFEPIPKGNKPKKRRKKQVDVAQDGVPVQPARKRGRPTKEEVARRREQFGITGTEVGDTKKGATWMAVRTIHLIRKLLDEAGLADRQLLVVGDGSYTNGTVICNLPERTDYLGRTGDASSLCSLSEEVHGGRPKYGKQLPTPEAIGKDPSVPEITGDFHYGGAVRGLRFKTIGPLYRPLSTRKTLLRLLVLQPVPYGRGEGRGYNHRAYLLTTDLKNLPKDLIQSYLDRWQIEVLHRDLKSGLGLGQSQVWREHSIARVHPALVATYAFLLIATLMTQGQQRTTTFGQLPKWRQNLLKWRTKKALLNGTTPPVPRPSVTDVTTLLRRAVTGKWTPRLVA